MLLYSSPLLSSNHFAHSFYDFSACLFVVDEIGVIKVPAANPIDALCTQMRKLTDSPIYQ